MYSKKKLNPEFYAQKKTKNKKVNNEGKDFCRHTEAERKSHYQQTCTTRNVKGSPSGRRKMIMISNENLEPHKGVKSLRNGEYVIKY